MLGKIIHRLTRFLVRQNIIVKDQEGLELLIPEEDTFSRLQASSVTYRFATGASRGKRALVLKSLPELLAPTSHSELVAKSSGFSLHAGVAVQAHERERLERITRYILRPALSQERLSVNSKAEVVLSLKKPWSDGTRAVKFTPLEFLEKLVALVPRPRVHLIRFHGVFAPNAKLRKQVVPQNSGPGAAGIAPVLDQDQDQDSGPLPTCRRIAWARLLKRVFHIDLSLCSKCGARMKILSAIEDPKVIKKILDHLGLPSTPPRLKPPRGPPDSESHDLFTQTVWEEPGN